MTYTTTQEGTMLDRDIVCDRCGRTFEDEVAVQEHLAWHERKDEGERTAALLAPLAVGTEFTLAGAGRAYSGTYRKTAEGLWDQVWAIEAPLVRGFDAAHLGFCVGFQAVLVAVARTVTT